MDALKNALLLIFSLLVAVIALEGGLRLFVHPVDYLMPTLRAHPSLGHRVDGNSGGHDEWGFRNYRKPDAADIVAIGDSMTYGIAASATDSWPAVLAVLTGKRVYNMALGGYGPLHYLYLLREYAHELHPSDVVVGVYIGNDLVDAANLAYTVEEWSSFRDLAPEAVSDDRQLVIEQVSGGNGVVSEFRDYLARHSVVYRIVTSASVFDRFRRVNVQTTDQSLFVFAASGRQTILTPRNSRLLTDRDDPKIAAGLRIAKRALLEMNAIAQRHEIRLSVVLVPTKVLVYSEWMSEEGVVLGHPDLVRAIEQENSLREELLGLLVEANIDVVDPLSDLRVAVRVHEIYPFNDGHPNSVGYRVIAERIARDLYAL